MNKPANEVTPEQREAFLQEMRAMGSDDDDDSPKSSGKGKEKVVLDDGMIPDLVTALFALLPDDVKAKATEVVESDGDLTDFLKKKAAEKTEPKLWEIEPEYPDGELPPESEWKTYTVHVKASTIRSYNNVKAPDAYTAANMYYDYTDDFDEGEDDEEVFEVEEDVAVPIDAA